MLYSLRKLSTTPKQENTESQNARYQIADYTIKGHRYRIYVLQPGQYFEGFGGSRHALCVKKTPSLIVRETGHIGISDTEYGVDNLKVWRHYFRWAAVAKAIPYTDEDTLIEAERDAQNREAVKS